MYRWFFIFAYAASFDLSRLPKSLLVGGQYLDRIMFCLKPFDCIDFSLKLTKYLMFPNSHFCVKNLKSSLPRKLKPCICNTSLPRALHNLTAVNQIVDENPQRKVTLSAKCIFSQPQPKISSELHTISKICLENRILKY